MGYCKSATILLLAILVPWVITLMRRHGVGRSIQNHHPGPCHLVDGIQDGSEDIDFLNDQHVLITSGLRFFKWEVDLFPDRKGQIFWFDLSSPEGGVTPVVIKGINLTMFNPHGMSIWNDKVSGEVTVFVVNHPTDRNSDEVLLFNWDGTSKTLTHRDTITDNLFRTLNDVVATGAKSFYATNSIYSVTDITRMVELLSLVAWGDVVFYNGQKVSVVASSLPAPNGINISPDGRYVYVALLGHAAIRIYERNQDNELIFRKNIPLNSSPDNIHVEKGSGDLWVGNHPIFWMMIFHSNAPLDNPSPSQVLRLKMSNGDVKYMEEVFAENNHNLYGSSVAVYGDGGMLVGTVCHKLMFCRVLHLGL